MIRNILALPDGSELTAGTPGQNALRSLRWTSTVNAGTDLNPGSACADSLEVEIWVAPGRTPGIAAGDELTLWRQGADGVRRKAGIFVAEQPARTRRNLYRLTAYDRMAGTEKDLSDWLRQQQDRFPLTLAEFAAGVAGACGLTLANDPPRNGDYQVRRFYADGLTGRQLLQWVAQAAGCYLHCNAEGALAFGWYTDRRDQYTLYPGGTGQDLPGTPLPYRQDGLRYGDYRTAPIDKVQIRQSDSDVGALYPPDAAGTNALVIQGNLLLTAESAEALRPVAQALYEAAATWPAYTPCTVSAFGDCAVAPGDLVGVVTPRGDRLTTCVMSRVCTAGETRLESTGNARRDSVAAVNAARLNLSGKLLEIQADIGQLTIQAGDLAGNYSQLQQSVDSLSLRVEQAPAANLVEGQAWVRDRNTPADCVTVTGEETRLQTRQDLGQLAGISLSVPGDQLAAMAGQTYRVRLDYKVETAIDTPGQSSGVVLWEYYADGNRSRPLVMFYNGGVGTPAGDWQTAELTLTCRDQAPTGFLVYVYLAPGQGRVALREPQVMAATNKYSEIVLDRDGVAISTAALDLSAFASQQDYTRLQLEQEELSLTVVKNGQVRSAFAADASSVSISSGRITFAANTLVVDSDNFQLTETGTVTITGMFFSEDETNRVSLANGALHFSRKVSDGQWLESAQLWSSGSNAACGNLMLFGPGATGAQYNAVAAYADYAGGALTVYNAAGQQRFWVRVNGDGDGEIWLNGRKLF